MLGASITTILFSAPLALGISSQPYNWDNVQIRGGGFVPNIIFNPSKQGLAYARTDIGGAYRLNSDGSTWTPMLDWVNNTYPNMWGIDALATDPIDTSRVYLAAGLYTNTWDPNNGHILASADEGNTWNIYNLPFKVGGNMPGRGMGERLAIDPNLNNVLYFGTRNGNGLWKSNDYGQTWSNITNFPSVGTYTPDPSDTTGYNSALVGIAWVTFDSTTGTFGSATPRIFVGVANLESTNIFVSNDAGATWAALAGQNSTYLPHKGVLSPKQKALYVSYSNGAGPYDGTDGYVHRYNISTGEWTDITPPSPNGGLYFGFGGLGVDYLNPGTIMVAALNCYWPEGMIYRSKDSGDSWSPIWAWNPYPTVDRYFAYNDTLAPWFGPDYTATGDALQLNVMMEGLSIDPFNSNHWLYGTGGGVQGGFDVSKWETVHNVTVEVLSVGIEEMAVQDLIAPPVGAPLISAVGDSGGFVHTSLTSPPLREFSSPVFATVSGIDFAGNNPLIIVRVGTGTSDPGECALSADGGYTWSNASAAPANVEGGQVSISADGDTVLWSSASNGVLQSSDVNGTFIAVSSLPSGAAIASDKLNNSIFYAASGSVFYTSTDGGLTFSETGTLGDSTAPVKVVVSPNATGDVWVSTDFGLFHSSSLGAAPISINQVTEAWAIALGASATSDGYPAIYAAATISGVMAYYRSDDKGVTWLQINDEAHGFGPVTSVVLAADPKIYGRIYLGTGGRGIFYGDIASGTSSPGTTKLTSTTSKPGSSIPHQTTSKISMTSHKSSSTSISVSKTSSLTSSLATPTSLADAYSQCGGSEWTGATACVSGYVCIVSNSYYSQCLPTK